MRAFGIEPGMNMHQLHVNSRDLTAFQTPLVTLRKTWIPMGYTSFPTVQHGDITFILQDEIPRYTTPFIDDVPGSWPETRYQLEDVRSSQVLLGTYASLLSYISSTQGRKLRSPLLGPKKPLPSRIQVLDWPFPKDLTGVRGFLGVFRTLRMFFEDFATHAEPLLGDNGLRYPPRHGSITWNSVERRYSQSKIELIGLFRALRDVRIYIVGVENFKIHTSHVSRFRHALSVISLFTEGLSQCCDHIDICYTPWLYPLSPSLSSPRRSLSVPTPFLSHPHMLNLALSRYDLQLITPSKPSSTTNAHPLQKEPIIFTLFHPRSPPRLLRTYFEMFVIPFILQSFKAQVG
ncbi:hypothetical protein NMY22_g15862 [Coprinellus aureogranulatus]|nr:hypothetical protein NMY22_g15862 [Coprinellus aureogranulatus]